LFRGEKSFNELHRIIAIEQILEALQYIHSIEIVHRDLKAENVVYSSEGGNEDFTNLKLKLIDFGFAHVNKQSARELKDFIGTPYYMAPEIIAQRNYGSEVDIWSLGILTYLIICG